MTAMEKAQIIKDAVDSLGAMLPLEWHDAHGRLIRILSTGIGELYQGGIITKTGNAPVWFKLTVDGNNLNGDGWYGYVNPPVSVPDGTFTEIEDEITGQLIRVANCKVDPLAAFFMFIEQAVS